MDTSLQREHLTADDLNTSLETYQGAEEAEQHIHMPGPSAWPFILSATILLAVVGILFIPDAPWLTIIAIPLILVGILGWALQDPNSHASDVVVHRKVISLPAKEVLDLANATVARVVTFSSTMFSTHPINVEIENETPQGVVLALYGKVELESQRETLEQEIRNVPGVLDVRDFVVAEDSILNAAYTRIEALRAAGKLEGASGISVLVENYILNLYGDVPTSKMKYTLERELIGIPGVRVIVNHIGLNKEIPGNLGKTRNA
jgi:Predicted periplasmic or secreted lipoprotein